MLIKILGGGCARGNRLEQLTREAVGEQGIDASFEHVRDMDAIMAYPIMTTPALVIDEVVKCSGRVPSKHRLKPPHRHRVLAGEKADRLPAQTFQPAS